MKTVQYLLMLMVLSVFTLTACDSIEPDDATGAPEFASEKPHPFHNPIPRPVSPRNGEIMDNGCTDFSNPLTWSFDWSEVGGEDGYQLYVKNIYFPNPLVNNLYVSSSNHTLSLNGYTLVDEGWFYRVRAVKGGVHGEWSPEVFFKSEPENTDCSWLGPVDAEPMSGGNGLSV